jgi:hypothetical protein
MCFTSQPAAAGLSVIVFPDRGAQAAELTVSSLKVTRLAADIPGIILIAGALVSVFGPEETRRLSERLKQMGP